MKNLPEITLAYDNMCNLQRMKVAQNELPFPVPYNNLWQNIEKKSLMSSTLKTTPTLTAKTSTILPTLKLPTQTSTPKLVDKHLFGPVGLSPLSVQ